MSARSRKPPNIGVERRDEGLHVGEELAAEDPRERRRGEVRPEGEDPHVGAAPRLGRGHQDADEAAVEEGPEPFRGVEEVEGGAGRRGVDDDEVPGALAVGLGPQLAELLHRHVLLGPGERAGDCLVEGVLEDLGRLLGGGVGEHDLVEGPLHVEHHRVERPARGRVDARHRPRRVVELVEAERLGQAAGGVDGEHDHLPPGLGRPDAERGGRRRLPDPAGAAADDDAGARVGEEGVDVDRVRVRAGWPSAHPLRDELAGEHRDPAVLDAARE